MIVAIVVVLVPIMFRAPPMFVFVPPAVTVLPAVFTGFMQFVTPVFSLLAVAAVVLDGFVQLVVCVSDSLLTIVIRANNTSSRQKHGSCERQGRDESRKGCS